MASRTTSTFPAEREPWDKQSGETAKSYAAFVIYREMGPGRSLAKVGQMTGKDITHIERWSARHGWVQRVEAYDVHLDRRARIAKQEEIEAMTRRHTRSAEALTTIGSLRLLGSRDPVPGIGRVERINPNELNAVEAATIFEKGVKIERISRGLPTDLTKSLDMITLREMGEFLGEVVDAALPRMPVEQREGYLREVREIGSRRSGQRKS